MLVQFNTRELSVVDTNGSYALDISSSSKSSCFVTVIQFIFMFFAARDKDKGTLNVKLIDGSYTSKDNQVLLESNGSMSKLWGFVGAMSSYIHSEDIDKLYIDLSLKNSSVQGSIVGKAVVYLMLKETQIP